MQLLIPERRGPMTALLKSLIRNRTSGLGIHEPTMDDADIRSQLVRHHPGSFGWALHCVRYDREEAEETLQTSYLKVLDGRARFNGRSSFRTWLFGVIHRTASERRRWRVARALLFDRWRAAEPRPTATADDLLAQAVRNDEARALVGALGRLPARQRDVLHLVFYQSMSIAETAAALGIRVGTARTHYERGKQRLRELMGEARP